MTPTNCPYKESITICRTLSHPNAEIISSKHCSKENAYLSSPECKTVKSTCTHMLTYARKTTCTGTCVCSSCLRTARKPMTIPTLLTSPSSCWCTSTSPQLPVFTAAGNHTPAKMPPRVYDPSGQGKWLRQRVTSVSFWAGGQRRASHVQRERGKQLRGRGNHKLGGRLCPS